MPGMFEIEGGILQFSLIMGGEILLLLLAGVFFYGLIRIIVGRLKKMSDLESFQQRCDRVLHISRLVITVVSLLLIAGISCFNFWLLFTDRNVVEVSYDLLRNLPEDSGLTIGRALLAIILGVVAARFLGGLIARLAKKIEQRAKSWEELKANDESISIFLNGIAQILTNVLWIFVVIFAFQQLHLPLVITNILYSAVTIYLIIAIGLSVVRMTNVIVDTLDGLSLRYAEKRSWHHYYQSLRPLVPLFRKCLEYILWIVVATMVLMQLGPMSKIAIYGTRLVEAIGWYFIARVVIEIGYLLINKQVMGNGDLDDTERRRRETLLPLVKNIFKNVAYFICFVLILRTLGFDPMPFLAGAGILGVVIGLGAQPLINDVMSGFFIILEHMYLVGDLVEGGGAYGYVESIDFRTTKIRDPEGRLHIVRNGDMRQIINYSKEFMYAVVDVDIRYDVKTKEVMQWFDELGKEIAQELDEVLEPTEIFGVLNLSHDYVTIRTKTKVRAGHHASVSALLRLRIKEVLDKHGVQPPAERQEVDMRNIVIDKPS